MAVIGTIREKFPTLLLILVGGAMLAYILGSFLTPGGGFSGHSNTIAVVSGKKISYDEFQNKVDQAIENYKQNQHTDQITTSVTQQIRTSVWNNILTTILLNKQMNPLGITVTPDELFNLITGNNPPPAIRKSFTDPKTGQYSRERVVQFLKSLNRQKPEIQQQWFQFEDQLQKQTLENKYYHMISDGIYTTTLEAKDMLADRQKSYDISFVLAPYNSISDSSIKLTSDDYENYYDNHKYEFKQDAGREIEYITYPITPSEKDKANILAEVNKVKQQFKTAKDDSAFVSLNSDNPFNPTYFTKGGGLATRLDTLFFSNKVSKDSIIGPYIENEKFHLAKISKIKYAPDSIDAEHILISVTNVKQDSAAKVKADSIEKVIKNGGDFAALAKKYSQDPGSAAKGGDLGWFTEGKMVPPFNDFCFSHKVGDVGVVRSRFGYHIIKILKATKPVEKIQVAQITKKIMPSNKTYESVFHEASTFSINNATVKTFEKAAKTKNKQIIKADVKPSAITVNNLQDPKDLIKWIFSSDQGKVSEPFRLDNTIIVAVITQIKKKGFAPLDQVKDKIKPAVINEKKAEILSKKMKNTTNLSTLATEFKTTVRKSNHVSFGGFSIPGMGLEPVVQGYISTMKNGKTSKPIQGNAGVYVVHIDSIITKKNPKANLALIQRQFAQREKMSVNSSVFNALKEKADVVDNRNKFY